VSEQPIVSPLDLFHHELRMLYYVELTLAQEVLPELVVKVHDVVVRRELERHLEETGRHAQTLELVFDDVAAVPRPVESAAFEGLRDEHDEALKRFTDAEQEVTEDLIRLSAVVKSEHLEIASYHSLIAAAQRLGEPAVAARMRPSLAEEEAALAAAEHAFGRLLRVAATA
jgi:ferritin-like metal-binding protein YciE